MPNAPRQHRPSHQPARTPDANRGTAHQRGYNRRWRSASKAFLDQHPLCAECQRHDRTTEATVVDHIEPHRGDQGLFWNVRNWQSLCETCHNRKTARGE